jgi:hypothetical protein
MCDYSLHHVNSRPAKIGDKLTTRNFGLGTRGFAASDEKYLAVCLLPGTELSFADEVRRAAARQKCASGKFRLVSMARRNRVTASSSLLI